MASLEQKFEAAVKNSEINGVVLAASDVKTGYYYAKAFGVNTLKEGADTKPLTVDTTFWMASVTKLMTAIAALQCVERGQFTLDEDITRLIPEFKDVEILKGFEERTEKPILVKSTKKITLRHLLTHSSGIGYDAFNPVLTRWRASRGEQASISAGTVIQRGVVPLLFEPGKLFEYSTGPDWAGVMVERTNEMSLGKYMQKYIWEPLGIKNITFHLEERPDMLERFPEMTERLGGMHPLFGTAADPSGKLGWGTNIWWRQGMTDDSGGAGAYGGAVDYQKILHSITAGDGKLLGPEMLEELFRPQLSDSARAQFALGRTIKQINDIQTSGVPIGTQMDYALGGAVLLEDLEGRRRKGTLSWGGLPNMYWWADRASGISGMYGSNLIPTGDPRSIEMFKVFEADVYEKAKSQGVKL